MRIHVLGGAVLAGLFAAMPSPVYADPITFYFTGVVDTVQGPLIAELLGPGVTAADLMGTTFHGSYTFDSAAPDLSGNSHLGQYQHYGAPYGMTFHFAHQSFSFDSIGIGVVNDFDSADTPPGTLDDIYAVQSLPILSPVDPTHSIRGRIDLIALGTALVGPAALLSDDLPMVPPDISAFELQRAFVNVLNEAGQVNAGLGVTMTSLSLNPVPEPTSLALLAGGLVVVGAARRARRGRAS